jgi:integrase
MHEKLVKAGLTGPRAQATTLTAFIDQFLAAALNLKPRTQLNIRGTKNRMVAFFGDVSMKEVRPADAEAWLAQMRRDGYADATIHRDLKRARQLFKRAVKHGVASSNPFDGIKGPKDTNNARKQYVPRATVAKCIDVAPDYEWRLMIGLSRYAGLRVPSELLVLQWTDWDMERSLLRVDSSKTGLRIVPIEPQLRVLLADAFDAAEPGSVYIIAKHRGENLRTEMMRIVKRAGLEPWERIFHNLRASCEEDWAKIAPMPDVCRWIGHDMRTAQRHYLPGCDESYAAVTGAFPVQQPAEGSRNEGQETREFPVFSAISSDREECLISSSGVEPDPRPSQGRVPSATPRGWHYPGPDSNRDLDFRTV